ncbi:MAG TPA: histidine kinase [Bryobacteraceae bacterium]|nr:histidine kinase [Bryobacteraceae bacterium]
MRERPTIVLLCGFGGLLLLMAGAETGALFFLSSLRSDNVRLQQRFLARNRQLEQIRSSIYLSGTYARDSLLAPEPTGAQAQKVALENLRASAETTLDEYAKSLDSEERAPFQSLRSEIDAYWKVLDRTSAWTAPERDKYRYEFFYTELIPRRTSMLQVADQIAQLNDQALQRGDQQLGLLYERLRLGLLAMILLTFLGGAALAATTIFFLLRLQGEARQRLAESLAARAGLRDLSAKMVRAQEDERRAISRELHDEAGQSFSAILMEAESLLELAPPNGSASHLESIRLLAKRGITETRNMALLLRPSMLDDFGLVPALNWQAKEASKRAGFRVHLSAGEQANELPEEHKMCIYRVVQEALTNVARHAQAAAVQVDVHNLPGKIRLTVQDDGSGFDAHRTRGLGILGMEERVAHLGGTLEIDSAPGRGSLLKVELPVANWKAESTSESAGPESQNGNYSHSAG